ncbi:MAG: sulfatase-like hydrolase/transferase [Proteobacteria bacterium]|nr:sulfatase-like hydrolase/transferase [Pseudomonadota bacterium]
MSSKTTQVIRVAFAAFWTAALAGLLVGAIDAVWSWSQMEQFLGTTGGKIACAFHVGFLYAATAAIVGTPLSVLVFQLYHKTDLGVICDGAMARAREKRDRAPRDAFFALGFTVAIVVLIGLALAAAYAIGLDIITTRKHKGLVVAVIVAVTFGLTCTAVVAAFPLGKAVEKLVALLPGKRPAYALSHPKVPVAAAAVLVAVAIAVAVNLAYSTLVQLDLRPFIVIIGGLFAFLALWPLGMRIEMCLFPKKPIMGWLVALGFFALALIFVFATGTSGAVRKGASAFTGLGAPLANILQRVADLDRDGYSAVLGGGDCNDWSASINPNAPEIPDDGIDQNCIAGDLTILGSREDVRFVPVPEEVPDKFNILLFIIDTVRAANVSAYGYRRKTTPVFDTLAKQGALFENFWANAPSTRYSVPALLTGRYPSQVLWDKSIWWPGLRLDNNTIAEEMKAKGFYTGAILNYGYFNSKRRINQGFDYYDNRNARLHQGRNPASTKGTSSKEQADATIQFLRKNKDRRFFLWTHFYDPHYEFEKHPGTREFGDDPVALYDHEILFTDQQMGRAIEELKQLGIYDNTVIVIVSDHGEGFGEHGVDFHGYHLYWPQTKVPLLIRIPGIPPQTVTMPASHVDLLPTLVNLIGGDPKPDMSGRSLLGEITGQAPPDADRTVFQEVVFEGPTEIRAAVSKKWHIIYNMLPDNTLELYDLESDPEENKDIWEKDKAKKIEQELLAWIDKSRLPPEAFGQLATALLDKKPTPAIPMDAVFDDKVKLLGLDLPKNPVKRGETIDITWYFKSLAQVRGRWRIFVHFEGSGRRFSGDHDPVEGALPLRVWKPGQIIADKQTITVPVTTRPGDYTIYMGIYKRKERMKIASPGRTTSGSRLKVGSIRITP